MSLNTRADGRYEIGDDVRLPARLIGTSRSAPCFGYVVGVEPVAVRVEISRAGYRGTPGRRVDEWIMAEELDQAARKFVAAARNGAGAA